MSGKAVQLCIATPDAPHPANTRTGRCRTHQDEYRAAMRHYNVLMHRYRNGEAVYPGDREEWEANITYSQIVDRWTMVSPETRHRLRTLLMTDSAAIAPLRVLLTEDGIYNTAPADIIAMVRDALTAHAATLTEIEPLTQEPNQ